MSPLWPRPFSAGLGLSLALLSLGSAGCPTDQTAGPEPAPSAADTTLITVDNNITHQIIAGFGGTTLPLVYPNGDHLANYRGAAIAAAYRDVAISVGMLGLGTQETPANATDRFAQRANDNADPFVIEPAGFNFADSDILLQKILQPAMAYGASDLSLGPFLNLGGPLSWLVPVRNANYSRYLDESAEYVVAIMRQWRDAYGLTPPLLHLFNEPTSGNAELQSSSVQEVVDLVKRIGDRLRAAGFASVKFIVPNEESISRSFTVAQAILADPAARPYVGVIGYHPYPYGSAYASPRRILEASGHGAPDPAARQGMEQLKALGQQYNVPVWMTEVSEGPGTNDYGFDAIENVLARAIHIHDNFEYAGASGYFGMLTLWDSQTHAEHFAGRNVPFLSEQSGMVLVDAGNGRIYITGMGYAVGHYARWIKPGVTWIAASSDHARVIVSAFQDPARSRIVVVAVNNEPDSQLLRLNFSGAQARGPVTGETSYGQVRWEAVPGFSVRAGGVIEFVARPGSIVSLAIPY